MNIWSAVVLTCRSENGIPAAFDEELRSLKKKGVFAPATELLVVEDPAPGLGSGGATLNALLVTSEHLCALKGYTVLAADPLKDARILIIHSGRHYEPEISGAAAFVDTPYAAGWISPKQCRIPLTPLLQTLLTVSKLADAIHGPGLWVCGADNFLALEAVPDFASETLNKDILAFSLPVDVDYAASKHGVYRIDNENNLLDLIYCGSRDEVTACRLPATEKVPLVLALVFLKPNVAESLLQLQNYHPLNRCTYLGVDSGALSLQLSFFFDFLAATCSEIDEQTFINGDAGTSKYRKRESGGSENKVGVGEGALVEARRLLWRNLRGYRSRVVTIHSTYFHYFLNSPDDMQIFHCGIAEKIKNLKDYVVADNLEFDAEMFLDNENGKTKKMEKMNMVAENGFHSNPVAVAFTRKKRKHLYLHLQIVSDVLRSDRHECLLPIFINCVLDGLAEDLLLHLDQIAIKCNSTSVIGRTLSCIADVLGLWAKGRGGLRSGPAQNCDWLDALRLLEADDIENGISKMANLRSMWSDRAGRLIRAARHYEAAAQIFIRRTVVTSVKQYIRPRISQNDGGDQSENSFDSIWYRARAAARIDLAGGWSDTPPITYEYGGAVLNVAIEIDDMKPIGAKTRRIREPVIIAVQLTANQVDEKLTFESLDDIRRYKNPCAPAALICAALVCADIVDTSENGSTLREQLMGKWGGGFEIVYWSDLPHGSGLGSSSILAGCLLATIWKAIGVDASISCILNSVLYVEQLLTTGGGWQDQVGGLCPGVKIGRFEGPTWSTAAGRARLSVESVSLSDERRQWLNDHLLLVYTGKTRLAKNLLQEVIRSWYARKPEVVSTIQALVDNAEKAKRAFEEGDWPTVAACARVYWEQKKFMVGVGGEPERVRRLLSKLYDRSLIDAGWLAGAGGGGFLYLLTKSPSCKALVETVLREEGSDMTAHRVTVDENPFLIDTE